MSQDDTRRRRIGLGLFCGVSLALAASAPAGDAYVRDPHVTLAANTSNDAAVTSARIWLSPDRGASWRALLDARHEDGFVHFQLPAAGRWGVYVVLENELGQSAPKAQPGMKPHAYVVFDPNPPTVQVRDVRVHETSVAGVLTPTFDFELTVVDEHLADDAIRVWFRENAAQVWRDGGMLLLSGDRGRWTLPDLTLEQVDLLVSATDLAGNRSVDQRTGIPLRVPAPSGAQQPAADSPAAHGPTATETADSLMAEESEPPLASIDALRSLHARARRHAELGQLPLAVARLREAFALAPGDWDTRLAYAEALTRTRDYETAGGILRPAVEERPDDARALEALAAVAVGAGDYFEARTHLHRLTELSPGTAAAWLRLGDVELKLGNARPATLAWTRAAEAKSADEALREKARRRLEYFAHREADHAVAASQ